MSEPSANDPLEQAAYWFAELQAYPHDARARHRWAAWLAASDANREAWARVEQIDLAFRSLPPAAGQALQPTGSGRRRVIAGLAGLLLAAPLGWLGWRNGLGRADYRTATGEQRDVRLPDGSRLWVNTDSLVALDFTARARRIELLRGEIAISTAADTRPLQVDTPEGQVQPLGTVFNVRLNDADAQVTVNAGRVRVTPRGRGLPQTVDAGQTLRFDRHRAGPPVPARGHETHWRDGVLLADDQPLGDFLAELSRYRPGVIRCDPAAAPLRLVGAFPLNDTDRALDALASSLPVRIRRLAPWWVQVEAAPRD